MKDAEIEQSSGNVYADLGFPDAAEMLVKAQLVAKISEILTARQWTQQQASKVLAIPQPKLSKMLRGQFRGISEAKMLDCLTRLGREKLEGERRADLEQVGDRWRRVTANLLGRVRRLWLSRFRRHVSQHNPETVFLCCDPKS